MPPKTKAMKLAYKGSDCTTDLGGSESDSQTSRLVIDEGRFQASEDTHSSAEEDIGPQLEAAGQRKKPARNKTSNDAASFRPSNSPSTGDSEYEPVEDTQESGSDSDGAPVSTYRSVADRAAILGQLPSELEPIGLLLLHGEFAERQQILACGRKIKERFCNLESKIGQLEYYTKDLVVLLALREIQRNPSALDQYLNLLPLPINTHSDLQSICAEPEKWTALKIFVQSSVSDDCFINFFTTFWNRLCADKFLSTLLFPMLTHDGLSYDYDKTEDLRYGIAFRMCPRDLHDLWLSETERRPGIRPIARQQDANLRSHVEDLNRMRRNDEWRNLLKVLDKADAASAQFKCAELLLADEHFHLNLIKTEAPWSETTAALESYVERYHAEVMKAVKRKCPSRTLRRNVWKVIIRGPRVKPGKYITNYHQ